MRAGWVVIGVLLGSIASAQVPQAQIDNRRCFNCHAQTNIVTLSADARRVMVAPATQPQLSPPSARPELLVTDQSLLGSVHGRLSCTDCHTDSAVLPHANKLAPATCNASCHTGANSEHLQGAHARAAALNDPAAPTCATCHGGHDIRPKSDRQSRTFPLNIVKVCSECHQQHASSNGRDGAQHVQSYLDSVHGRAVSGGLSVAATCADCHSNHKVLAANAPESSVNRTHIADTCGRCHTGVTEVYSTSIHGRLLAQGNTAAPVCSDCHTAHGITRTDTPTFKLDIVRECGTCHDKPREGSMSSLTLYDTYRMSYHGQVTNLGLDRAARCSDCHGAHDVMKIEEPASRLSAENRVATCKQCHANASQSFAQFDSHADPYDSERFPLLYGARLYFVIMMSFAFGFFGLHSIFWFVRSWIDRIRHGPLPSHHHSAKRIKRFTRVDRVNHAFVITSFFGLTLTGLPLFFSDQEWGRKLMALLGGPTVAGHLHRFFAIMLIGNFVVHFVGVFNRFRKHGFFNMLFGPTTMLPRWKDFTDCFGMWKWFFKGGKKPKFDRWTYWEKFDYVAEVGGSMIIGISGLMLWFPEAFSAIMPGWMFNIATLVHGYEALLAIGFIFTIHFFNAHLRLEKFPVDDVMFSGSLPEEEFKEERGAEYERLVARGELDALRVGPPRKGYRVFAVIMGMLAMAIGTTLVVLIILAGLRWI